MEVKNSIATDIDYGVRRKTARLIYISSSKYIGRLIGIEISIQRFTKWYKASARKIES